MDLLKAIHFMLFPQISMIIGIEYGKIDGKKIQAFRHSIEGQI